MDNGEILGCNRYDVNQVGWAIHFWFLKENHFVRLDPLTRPVNNPINIFLINPRIILYYVLFIKYLCISKILLVSIELKSTEKNFTASPNPVFLILLIVKPFEILPKQSVYLCLGNTAFCFRVPCFKLTYFSSINKEEAIVSIDVIQILGCVKLIACIASAANAVSSNPCVGPTPRIKVSFSFLSICNDDIVFITTDFPSSWLE